MLNVKFTGHDPLTAAWARGPSPQGGYQLDGREDTLADQALGAFRNHAQVTADPDRGALDDIAAYETALLADPEPPLDDLETMGSSCAHKPCSAPFLDDWQKLEIPPLHGISRTAPYFHNNSAATLEDVVIH